MEQTLAHGGRVSYRSRGNGSPQVYELNTTVYDFLNDPARPDPLAVPRFLAAQAILLTLAGVPGIYIHSLFGSRNCHDCFAQTGQPRSLNRRKFTLDELHILLTATDGHAGHVFAGMNALLRERRRHPAFHPAAGQEILDVGRAVFAVRRTAKDASETMVCLVNVSSQARSVSGWAQAGQVWHDRLSGRFYRRDELVLAPYGIAWLTPV